MRNFYKKNLAFTLIEIMIVLVILAVLMTLAWPHYSNSLEKAKAQEGANLLQAVLGAQKRYTVDNGATPTAFSQLDITIPNSQNFNTPTLIVPPGTNIAQIQRVQNSSIVYTLSISGQGTITCSGNSSLCSSIGF